MTEERIQLEIEVKGPVQAAFTVYEDFGYYKKGVYVINRKAGDVFVFLIILPLPMAPQLQSYSDANPIPAHHNALKALSSFEQMLSCSGEPLKLPKTNVLCEQLGNSNGELKKERFVAQPIPKEAQELSGEALVEYAEYSSTVAALRMGSLMKAEFAGKDTKMKQVLTTKQPVLNDDDPPESFDGREYWKDCPSTLISDTDFLACCGRFCGIGCQGGYGTRAWAHAQIVARLAYWVLDDELVIRADIMELGPVQASFTVYEDFAYYKRGIYVDISVSYVG
ncbi:unnamed protein product [Haemonchus placei]|uniref:Calpain catalytic domain-containing protein n=1 Tax=Haemonchus placei TaxID=6290 RepID=A0A0N4WMW5_HAEPC|nr:unnamed protein product [Haemonchus placei]